MNLNLKIQAGFTSPNSICFDLCQHLFSVSSFTWFQAKNLGILVPLNIPLKIGKNNSPYGFQSNKLYVGHKIKWPWSSQKNTKRKIDLRKLSILEANKDSSTQGFRGMSLRVSQQYLITIKIFLEDRSTLFISKKCCKMMEKSLALHWFLSCR